MRFDGELPAHEARPLVHAHQAQRAICARALRIEARAVIGHDEAEVPVGARELHFRGRPAAVLHHIVQSLLRDAVESERRVTRHRPGHLALGELNRDLMREGEFLAEPAHRGDEAESIELRRMQVV